MPQDDQNSAEKPRIVRGQVDSLNLYEVTDYELDLLEKGSPNSIYLNFSIFLLSVGISFLVTVLTTKIESDRIFTVFVVVTVLGLLIGMVLLVLWYRTRGAVSGTIRRIKDRMPPDLTGDESAEDA